MLLIFFDLFFKKNKRKIFKKHKKSCRLKIFMLEKFWKLTEFFFYFLFGGVMKKVLYTILSILSVVYICFLIVNVIDTQTAWEPDMGAFRTWFDLIVNFGGVAIIFCFALVNFAGNPLKVVFFIILIVAIVVYIIVMACPDVIYSWFSSVNPLSLL